MPIDIATGKPVSKLLLCFSMIGAALIGISATIEKQKKTA